MWLDADDLFDRMTEEGGVIPFEARRPLSWADAAKLARLYPARCEHLSDGSTRIWVCLDENGNL